ncbi:helix-turn-helix transcriptional regulator [Xanthobacter sp. AM11]|uniref:helix-turn-helix transcriptional regulator n=1 Tax=Xanthobacter sp. AM11 TaxID=3380643 RepID=UPI0039BFDF18
MTSNRPEARPALIRLEAVKVRTCLSRSTIYAYMREGRFPQPVAISERCVAWIEAEIDGWIAERIALARRG